jgi:hypothetical protein
MSWLYALAQPFVWHAERAAAVAIGLLAFAACARALRAHPPHRWSRSLLTAAAAWLLFAALEAEARRERADIRVDLLLTWPALCLVTAGCLGWWLWSVTQARGASNGV